MLFNQIKLGYPSLWIKSTEFDRLINSIVQYNFREYFTIDTEKGFSQYIDGSWKPVLVDIPDPEQGGTILTTPFDLSLCYEYINKFIESSNKQVSLIIKVFGKPESIMNYVPLISSLQSKHRNMFWSDEIASYPQIIFISSFDVPEDYSYLFKSSNFAFPNAQELYQIIDHINVSSEGKFVAQDSIKEVVRSGLGLNESEFIDYCLQSVVENGTVDPKYIYDNKMRSIKQHGILEIIKPTMSFDNIGGLDNIKDIIRRTAFLRANKDQADKFGVVPIRRVLMVGIPGTGKSAICQATANELQLDLARTGISQVMNSFVGQSEANMRAVFNQIKAMNPLCVWIDEFGRDLSGGASSASVDAGTTDRVHGEFLTGLQELPEETFLMCAANQLDNLRPEMLRADRFDKIIFVGMPSLNERLDILKIYLKEINTDHEFDYHALAESTEYFTGAEISSLIREVKFFVVSQDFRPINTRDIISYVPKIRNTIWNKHRDMVQSMYQFALEQWDWASTEQYNDANMIISGRSSVSPEVSWKI
jgi:ATP-dependent 26S proteasome regulatory subunit